MMKKVVTACLFGVFATPALAQVEPWGVDRVHAFVAAHEPKSGPDVDPFSVPVMPDAPNTNIVIRQPIVMTGQWDNAVHGEVAPGFLEYDAKTQTLTANISLTSGAPYANEIAELNGRYLGSRRVSQIERKSHAGARSNSFGAKTNVIRDESLNIALAQITRSWDQPVFAGNYLNGGWHQHAIKIAPEEGRALSQHLEVRTIATPAPLNDGTHVVCRNQVSVPTMSDPVERNINHCYMLVTFNKVQLVDTRDQSVLVEVLPRRR